MNINNLQSKLKKFTFLVKLLEQTNIELNNINNINYICTLSLITEGRNLNKRFNDQTLDIIFSSKLVLDKLSYNIIKEKILDIKLNSDQNIHIILISIGLDFTSQNQKISSEYILESNYNSKLILEQYSYNMFMSNLLNILKNKNTVSNLNNTLGPIFIFQGLHLSNIISLFKENGYTLHGGSTSLRHKLSNLERDLAIFLFLTNLDGINKKIAYYNYVDSVLSSNKLDQNLYNFFKYNINFRTSDFFNDTFYKIFVNYPVLYIFILRSLYLDLKSESNILKDTKDSLIKEISYLNSITSSEFKLDLENNYKIQISKLENLIRKLSNELVENQSIMSGEHKKVKRHKLKKYQSSLKALKDEKLVSSKTQSNAVVDKNSKELELSQLETTIDSLDNSLSDLKLKNKQINNKESTINSANYKLLNKSKDLGKREYSTLISNKNLNNISNISEFRLKYKNYKLINKNKKIAIRNFTTLNNPIKEKILEILYSNESKVEIQKNIEKFLMYEQNIDLQSKEASSLNNLPGNYPQELKNIIIESNKEIVTLYQNYLNNNNKQTNINQDNKFLILSKVDIKAIINNMYTIFFKIIKNANLINKETYSTENFYILGKVIVENFLFQEFRFREGLINKKIKFSTYKIQNPEKFQILDDTELLVSLGSLLIG